VSAQIREFPWTYFNLDVIPIDLSNVIKIVNM